MPETDSTPLTALDHYRLLGESGLRVSPLCLGTMTFGADWGWGADEATSREIFNLYADRGGNFIDTANVYTNGTSERYVGKFLRESELGRDFFVLATKYSLNTVGGFGKQPKRPDPNAGGNHRKNMIRSVEDSLERLDTDYIDLFWLHIWDFSTPTDELMRACDDLVRSGKIVYIAISDTPAWKIAELNTFARCHALSRFICTQVEYSLVERGVERDILPMCRELKLGLLPWSPLAGGVLTGKYGREDLERQERGEAPGESQRFNSQSRPVNLDERKIAIAEAVKHVAEQLGRSASQVALNWLLRREGVTSVILGARKTAQLEDNLASLDFTVSDEQFARLAEVSRIEKGFPHDFIDSILARDIVRGGAEIDLPRPDKSE